MRKQASRLAHVPFSIIILVTSIFEELLLDGFGLGYEGDKI